MTTYPTPTTWTPLFDLTDLPDAASSRPKRRAAKRSARRSDEAGGPDLFSSYYHAADRPRSAEVWEVVAAMRGDVHRLARACARRRGARTQDEFEEAESALILEFSRLYQQRVIQAGPGEPPDPHDVLRQAAWAVGRALRRERAERRGVSRSAYERAGRGARGEDVPEHSELVAQAAEHGMVSLDECSFTLAAADPTPDELMTEAAERDERIAKVRSLLANLPADLRAAALEAIDRPRARWGRRHFAALVELQRLAGLDPDPELVRRANPLPRRNAAA